MQIWFCSDFHFGHEKIIEYCKRPFENLKQMDSILVKNFNERVDENDLCFFLGDFCLSKSSEAITAPKDAFNYYRNQLKCKNIIFFRGNHDGNNKCKSIIESIVIQHGGKRIYLTHNPKFAKEDFHWNFCGHTHGNQGTFKKLGRKSVIIDLSVDCWNFTPVDINEINQAYSDWCRGGHKNGKTN